MQHHYGSAFAPADWTNQAHNIYVTTSYVPREELRLFGTITYNRSKGELDQVIMPDLTEQLDGGLHHMDYDFSQIHNYSDIDFALWRLTLGFDYRFSAMWKGTLDVNYADLTDKQAYVYGDESGSYYVVRAAARMSF